QAKAFCACVSPALTYPMIHIVGVTPEARTLADAFGGKVPHDVERVRIGKKEIAALFDGIHQTERTDVDAVMVGCPLLILDELAELAAMLEGRTVKTRLWLFTDYVQYSAARKAGIIERIESSGARVVHSHCPGMVARAPEEAENMVVATDSLKVAMLFAGIGWPRNWLGTREDAIRAAVNGRFERTRWLS
ncbi:MAG: DUF521 domain-containing protein, partial [Actinobacteria bacterium]|nr:DUF521 domain-containing protein [Actinomycetota bacterium]